MAGGLNSADIDLELKREVLFWQKTEVYTKETVLATIVRRERKAESLNKINLSSFSATDIWFLWRSKDRLICFRCIYHFLGPYVTGIV